MAVSAVVGTQWGDEGKGKVVDYLAERSKYVVRFQGGNNAGHTIVVGDEVYKLHLLPSGLVSGKAGVIGNGCVVDPFVLMQELSQLQERGLEFELHLSDRAHLILPYHKLLDGAEEALKEGGKIGTTGRGIGPCYADKASRVGVRAGDLLRPDVLQRKVFDNVAVKQAMLRAYGSKEELSAQAILDELAAAAEVLGPYVTDTATLLQTAARNGDGVLLEGAQGVLLDLDHGTYPYVTSSSISGAMTGGSGLSPRDIGDVIGVVKAYTTRVGEGPFPTELPTDEGVGEHLARVGHEFGTTTGRPRRCGWLDLVVVNHSVRLCGVNQLAVTKLDVLNGLDEVKVCTHYLLDGQRVDALPADLDELARCEPVYETFEGWGDDLGDGEWENLPATARIFLQFLREKTEAQIKLVGIGPARHETIVRK
ncbi:MAG: adenylosuccinate synthase [Thermoplasmatota archaeon]